MTFNVLCSFCNDEYDPWEERLGYFADIFERHDPDLIGLQEMTWPEEVDQFLTLREGFEAVYFVGESEGPFGFKDYPDATILYRSGRFTLQDKGFFWLSTEPEEPWSTGWAEGLQFSRIVAWAIFEDAQSENMVFVVNTHFDNNTPNQEHSAPLLLERVAPHAGSMPVIVTGDFNSQPDDEAYEILTEGVDGAGFKLTNSFDLAADWSAITNQDPEPGYDFAECIDHIFVAGENTAWECSQWTVDQYVYGQEDEYPSDHRAISAVLEYALNQ